LRDQSLGQVRADESGGAGYERSSHPARQACGRRAARNPSATPARLGG
jgi:hypothetical protein